MGRKENKIGMRINLEEGPASQKGFWGVKSREEKKKKRGTSAKKKIKKSHKGEREGGVREGLGKKSGSGKSRSK